MNTPTYKAVITPSSTEVKLVTYGMYYMLHREVNNVHYLGHSDHRIGLSIRVVELSEIKFSIRPFKLEKQYEDLNGKWISYIDEPYTESQIDSFARLTEEELQKWVQMGN